jgi:hypothetical protein
MRSKYYQAGVACRRIGIVLVALYVAIGLPVIIGRERAVQSPMKSESLLSPTSHVPPAKLEPPVLPTPHIPQWPGQQGQQALAYAAVTPSSNTRTRSLGATTIGPSTSQPFHDGPAVSTAAYTLWCWHPWATTGYFCGDRDFRGQIGLNK